MELNIAKISVSKTKAQYIHYKDRMVNVFREIIGIYYDNHKKHIMFLVSVCSYYIKNQQDATLAVLFIRNCKITCFGSFLCLSSGVLKTVVTATGACHGSG